MGLIHWGRVTHICVGKLTFIGSDNGLSPGRRQAIIWSNAGILLIGPLGTNFSEILIEIDTFSFKKMSSGKWRPCCLSLNVLMPIITYLWTKTVKPNIKHPDCWNEALHVFIGMLPSRPQGSHFLSTINWIPGTWTPLKSIDYWTRSNTLNNYSTHHIIGLGVRWPAQLNCFMLTHWGLVTLVFISELKTPLV